MDFIHTEVWRWWEKPWISKISQRELCLPSPAFLGCSQSRTEGADPPQLPPFELQILGLAPSNGLCQVVTPMVALPWLMVSPQHHLPFDKPPDLLLPANHSCRITHRPAVTASQPSRRRVINL